MGPQGTLVMGNISTFSKLINPKENQPKSYQLSPANPPIFLLTLTTLLSFLIKINILTAPSSTSL